MTFKQKLLSSLVHTLELAAVFAVAYGFVVLLNLEGELKQIVITAAIGFLVKFARADSQLIDDYVNKK